MTDDTLTVAGRKVCPWVGSDPVYLDYHDHEWGIPVHDDRQFFELLSLEAMQAGLSWITILRRRDAFREAFDDFYPDKIALYDESDITRLMQNAAIIRNRRKIEAIIRNAKAFLEVQKSHDTFDAFLWSYAPDGTIVNRWENIRDIPARSPLSEQLSHDLKQLGFSFVGPTIMYAFLQASGVIDDHLASCDRATPGQS